MKKGLSILLLTLACSLYAGISIGQIVSNNLFLQGKYLEVGLQRSGALGTSVSAPTGYHPHGGTPPCGSSSPMASVYDWGKDGWSTGTPAYMGDYTLPGSPWEEWAIQVGGTMYPYNSSSCGTSGTFSAYGTPTGTLGPWWSTVGTRAVGTWSGSVGSGTGTMNIRKEQRVDTLRSALIVTVVLTNPNATALNDVYYIRACDPDNNQSWSGGSFSTVNEITYQNDYYHRVMVTAYATGSTASTGIPPAPYSIGTKDCRAKSMIFTSWPLSCTDLAGLWSGSVACAGTVYTALNGATGGVTGDIAIALMYKLNNIPAYDSIIFSYAYIYDGKLGIDSAFPAPRMVVDGVGYDSLAVLTSCGGSLGDTLPVDIFYGTDKCWSWSNWTWASTTAGMAALLTDTGVVNGVVMSALSGTTTYTITGTQRMQDCAAKQFILTIIPSSTGAPGVSDVYYCQGDFPSPLTATGTSLLWYTTATGGTGSATAPTPSTATPGMTTYYVTQSPCAGLESVRAAVHVYVTARPIVVASSTAPVCAGYPLTLYANDTFTTGTRTYSWTGPGGFTSTSRNPYFPSASATDSGYYTVVLTVNGCVSLPDTDLVVVHASPVAPVTTPVTYCQYYSGAAPLIATGSNLLWYTSATGGSGTPITPTPSTSAAGTFTYYVTQTSNGCESARAPLLVTINAQPAAPAVVLQTYCQYDLPSPLSASGASLLWYGPGVSGSSTAPTPSTTTPGVDTYYVTQTVLGCVSPRAADPVTVIAKPTPPIVENHTYCQKETAPPLTGVGVHVRWYTTPSGGSALPTAPTPSTSTVGTTTWYVTQTINGCESDRVAQSVTILYLPIFTITQSRPFVCQYDTLTFTYNGPALTSAGYAWLMPTGSTYVSGTSVDPSVIVRFDSLYHQVVMLTASGDSGRCFTTDTIHINVVPEPKADAYIKGNICQYDTIVIALSSRTSNSDHFTWDFDGADIITSNSNTGGPYKISWLNSGVHVVKMTAYTTEGCPGLPTYDTVKVSKLPDARIHTPNLSGLLCMEDSVYLYAETDDHSKTYTWAPKHFFHNNNNHEIWGKIERVGYVTLTVADAFGCVAVDSVLLTPDACCKVLFPSGFTPGAASNRKFRPVFNGFHRFHSFRVVNRWGQTVFESANNNTEWDGTFGGVPQDAGVYYYYIKFDCEDGKGGKEQFQKGEVTLIR